jgi:hypothetical protein
MTLFIRQDVWFWVLTQNWKLSLMFVRVNAKKQVTWKSSVILIDNYYRIKQGSFK